MRQYIILTLRFLFFMLAGALMTACIVMSWCLLMLLTVIAGSVAAFNTLFFFASMNWVPAVFVISTGLIVWGSYDFPLPEGVIQRAAKKQKEPEEPNDDDSFDDRLS